MKCKQIIFTEPNKAELLENDVPELKNNEILIETMISTISCGTERANITGDANVNACSAPKIEFPRMLGYSASGVVKKKAVM